MSFDRFKDTCMGIQKNNCSVFIRNMVRKIGNFNNFVLWTYILCEIVLADLLSGGCKTKYLISPKCWKCSPWYRYAEENYK